MLVNCVVYEQGQRLADIAVSDIRTHLANPGCFVWVALKDPDPSELETLQEEFGLHELAVEDAQHGHQRPKIEEYGASLFVVLHMVEWPGDDLQTGEVAVFVGPQYIISVRREAQHGFAEVRRRCEQEPDLLRHGPGLCALRADGHRGRSLLPGARPHHRGDRDASRSASSPATPRGRRSRPSTP